MARHLLRIPERGTIRMLHDISVALDSHKGKRAASEEFVVEGSMERPKIIIRYPGNKVKRRELKDPGRKGAVLWEALYDFLVVPFMEGSEMPFKEFNYRKIAEDFFDNKKDSEGF